MKKKEDPRPVTFSPLSAVQDGSARNRYHILTVYSAPVDVETVEVPRRKRCISIILGLKEINGISDRPISVRRTMSRLTCDMCFYRDILKQ